MMTRKLYTVSCLSHAIGTLGYLQNWKEDREEDNRKEEIAAPESKPMASQCLCRRPLDSLQLQGVHLLQTLHIIFIVEALLGHGPAVHTQRELGRLGAEIARLVGEVLCFSHCGGSCPWRASKSGEEDSKAFSGENGEKEKERRKSNPGKCAGNNNIISATDTCRLKRPSLTYEYGT